LAIGGNLLWSDYKIIKTDLLLFWAKQIFIWTKKFSRALTGLNSITIHLIIHLSFSAHRDNSFQVIMITAKYKIKVWVFMNLVPSRYKREAFKIN
jgi:hypothetical protein